MSRITLQSLVTKTGAFTGTGVAVSSIPLTLNGGTLFQTLVIHVGSIDPSSTARLVVWDSVDNFDADITPVYVAHIYGGLGQEDANENPLTPIGGDRVIRVSSYDIPDARFGVSSAKMRVDLVSIDQALGGTLSSGIQYEAWIDY